MTDFINERGALVTLESQPDQRLAYLKALFSQDRMGNPESVLSDIDALQLARAAYRADKVAVVKAASYQIHPSSPGYIAWRMKSQNGAMVFDEGVPGVPGLQAAETEGQAWDALAIYVHPYPTELYSPL